MPFPKKTASRTPVHVCQLKGSKPVTAACVFRHNRHLTFGSRTVITTQPHPALFKRSLAEMKRLLCGEVHAQDGFASRVAHLSGKHEEILTLKRFQDIREDGWKIRQNIREKQKTLRIMGAINDHEGMS